MCLWYWPCLLTLAMQLNCLNFIATVIIWLFLSTLCFLPPPLYFPFSPLPFSPLSFAFLFPVSFSQYCSVRWLASSRRWHCVALPPASPLRFCFPSVLPSPSLPFLFSFNPCPSYHQGFFSPFASAPCPLAFIILKTFFLSLRVVLVCLSSSSPFTSPSFFLSVIHGMFSFVTTSALTSTFPIEAKMFLRWWRSLAVVQEVRMTCLQFGQSLSLTCQ